MHCALEIEDLRYNLRLSKDAERIAVEASEVAQKEKTESVRDRDGVKDELRTLLLEHATCATRLEEVTTPNPDIHSHAPHVLT